VCVCVCMCVCVCVCVSSDYAWHARNPASAKSNITVVCACVRAQACACVCMYVGGWVGECGWEREREIENGSLCHPSVCGMREIERSISEVNGSSGMRVCLCVNAHGSRGRSACAYMSCIRQSCLVFRYLCIGGKICIYVNTYIYIYIYEYAYEYKEMYICIYIYIYVYIYVYIYICIYITIY